MKLSQAIMSIENGKRYVFITKKSGTALDLDTRDNRSPGRFI